MDVIKMKTKSRGIKCVIISLLLIFISIFSTSCSYDPDEAVNIRGSITDNIIVQEDSTVFYFYYESAEHPIEDYAVIKVSLDYYVDYKTPMRKKTFFIFVPDDVKYEEQTYFTVEIDDVLTSESVVYLSVLANYKTEGKNNSMWWKYLIAIIVAIVLLIGLWSVYAVMCDACYSNSALPSFMWLGGLIIYIIATIIITSCWGSGPGGMIIGGAVLYFICTLFTYFKYKL